jgi:signal transduction histidine kinase
LFIAGEIVKRHGGTITVQSASGEGTTFTLTLPLQHENGGRA